MKEKALYYFGIIEGVAHSRGEDAYPVKFWNALKSLGELLDCPEILPKAKTEEEKKAIVTVDTAMKRAKKTWSPEALAASEERKKLRKLSKKNPETDQEKIDRHIEEKGKTIVHPRYAEGAA